MDDECEKLRMEEATNEWTILNYSLNLGSEEIPIEKYVQLAWQTFVHVEYNRFELVDLAWGRKIDLGLDLNEEPMEVIDVGDQSSQKSSFLKLRVSPITIL